MSAYPMTCNIAHVRRMGAKSADLRSADGLDHNRKSQGPGGNVGGNKSATTAMPQLAATAAASTKALPATAITSSVNGLFTKLNGYATWPPMPKLFSMGHVASATTKPLTEGITQGLMFEER